MNARLTLGCAALVSWSLANAHVDFAQSAANAAVQASVSVLKLAPLKYPPLARQARITGDVIVDLKIRTDGSIASAELFSGHPMLASTAVQNARESTFVCRQCTETASYRLTYTFDVYDDGSCTVPRDIRVRSSKCLYLWKCGHENVYPNPTVAHPGPEITESAGHVKIRAPEVCVETEAGLK